MKRVVLDIARDSIAEMFLQKRVINREELLKKYPELGEDGAVFVTLTEFDQLRGCIGSLDAYQPLIDDIIANAKSAAFRDPRFQSLSEDEFKRVKIEVSILSKPEIVKYRDIDELRDIIRPNIDGVVLEKDFHRATFLPQVWEELPTFDLFFQHLCLKAGMGRECLNSMPTISLYQVDKIEE